MRHATPVDDALPFIAVVIMVLAAVTHPAIQLAVPLLMAGEIVVPDERTRLMWFGVVIAISFAAALMTLMPGPGDGGEGLRRRQSGSAAVIITIAAILLLRWIPLRDVLVGREIFLLLLAVGIVLAFGRTPFAVALAVAAALFTPAVPLRTLALPLFVLFLGAGLRRHATLGLRLPPARALAAMLVALPLTFFAWSGVVARVPSMIVRGLPAQPLRHHVGMALGAGESVRLDVPSGARALVLSGANVQRLKSGSVLGQVAPIGAVVRIGDVADWGAFRREQFYRTRNPFPRHPAGLLRDYGQSAWIDGAGRIALPRQVRVVVVTADRNLPPGGSLQIDAFELERR